MFYRWGKLCAFTACALGASVSGLLSKRNRAVWRQTWARRFSTLLGLRVTVSGPIPRDGLIVANHLGYLDILALLAAAPCVFVAKREVKSWPLLGVLAVLAGTIFVDRNHMRALTFTVRDMRSALQQHCPLVLFAEGTSSDGQWVLPFRPSLLQPVCELGAAPAPAHLAYDTADAAYWGDMTFLPHLWRLLDRREIRAELRFGQPLTLSAKPDRKQLAAELHTAVSELADKKFSYACS